MSLEIIRTVQELRARVAQWREQGLRHAVVPTMGALHDGHGSLITLAAERADRVIVTLFVNPKQFGSGSDLEDYPRAEEADRAFAAERGADVLFAPELREVYPEGFCTTVDVGGLAERLEGEHRRGHFAGVATVVCKLLTMTQAPVAIFGDKDFQQVAVVRRMVADLNLDVEIVSAPTIREADGLAMSSRNRLLTAEQRRMAPSLHAALTAAADAILGGASVRDTLMEARDALEGAGFGPIDYVDLVDPKNFQRLNELDRQARLLAAAHLGKVRMIDNIPVDPMADNRSDAIPALPPKDTPSFPDSDA